MLENIEARFLFGQRSFERDQFLFRAVEQLALLFQSLFVFAHFGEKNVDALSIFLRSQTRGGNFFFSFVSGRACFRDRCVEIF